MFAVGERVSFLHQANGKDQETIIGTIRFVGPTNFAPDEWLGVELDEKVGKNDGSVKGKHYFQCEPGYGLFIRPRTARKVSESQPQAQAEAPSQAPAKATARASQAQVPESQPPGRAEAPSQAGRGAELAEKAAVESKLAAAIEDRDVRAILQVFRSALNLGVDAKEMERAFQTVKAEAQLSYLSEMDDARRVACQLSQSLEELQVKLSQHMQEKVERLGAGLEARVSEMLSTQVDNIAKRASQDVLNQEAAPKPDLAAIPAKEPQLAERVRLLEEKLKEAEGASRLQELEKQVAHVTELTRSFDPKALVVARDLRDLEEKVTQLARASDAKVEARLERRISHLLEVAPAEPEKAKEGRIPPHQEMLEGKKKPQDYEDALAQVGGETKLEEFRELSTRLMDEYRVSPEMAKALPADWNGRTAYSVKLNYQNYVNNLDELIDRCRQQKDVFFDKVHEIATKTHGKNCKPPLKSKDRCEAKAMFKYRDASGEVSWHRLTDVVRDTIVYGSLKDMYDGLQLMHEDKDLQIVEFNDRYFNPLAGGYRDLQLTVRIGDIVCELQLNVAGMIYIKEGSGHRTFEVARELAAAVADTSTEAVKRARNILKWGKDHLGHDADKQLKDILSSSKTPLLLKAAQTGNSELMSIFLEHGANVNVRDESLGQTALHKAMEGGYERAMWLLLEHKAQVDMEDHASIVPLMQGLLQLRSQPDSEFIGRAVCTLSQVAGISHLQDVQDNLKKVVQDKLKPSSQLLGHCRDGDVQSVRELLKHYADPNSPNEIRERPLHKALSPITDFTESHLEICRLLLQFGADSNARDDYGRTPLVLASRLGSHEAVDLLVRHGAAAQAVQVEDVQSLLQRCGDASGPEAKAVVATLKVLQTAGCDFTAATSEGELPTFFAARAGNTEALQLLQTAGCDLGKRSHNGDLALVAAARAGQKNAVEWLLQAGSGSKIKKLDMQRAFHVACKLTQPGHGDLVSLLEEQVGASSQSHKLSRNLLRLGKFGEETDFKKPVTARLKEKAGRGTGKYYHEMQLLTRFEWIQAGWATSAFEGDRDLGRHREGWCWEGWLSGIMEKSHAGKAEQVQMRPWEPGDVLGFALDYNGGKMHLSHQGTWYPEKEADYFMDFEPNGRDLFPAVTTKGGLFRLRFGREAWSFKPPAEEYEPWAEGVGEWDRDEDAESYYHSEPSICDDDSD